jgi:cell division protease FtsH
MISPREKEITAFHEAGHALVGHLLPHADPIAKVTIISRGATGGHTRSLPEEDRHMWTLNQFKDTMAQAMGGRVAEEVNFGADEITTGAGNDLEQATHIARTMVTRYGMSSKLGPRTFGKRDELIFLGREISEQRDYSDSVAETIDTEVHRLVEEAYASAKRIITTQKVKLDELAKYLVENETAESEVLEELFGPDPGKAAKLSPPEAPPAKARAAKPSKPRASRAKPKPKPAEPSPAAD